MPTKTKNKKPPKLYKVPYILRAELENTYINPDRVYKPKWMCEVDLAYIEDMKKDRMKYVWVGNPIAMSSNAVVSISLALKDGLLTEYADNKIKHQHETFRT